MSGMILKSQQQSIIKEGKVLQGDDANRAGTERSRPSNFTTSAWRCYAPWACCDGQPHH
jgi:hypothetical protein